uniref:Uncharacterized protein n=1 Tax=uncultured Elusimicrobia bacterium TaxID=699876 RepID=A0A650EN63_9BACT|nr:hypothetical protein Elusimicrob1349_0980 [uncultured Elusimicrobia bacterium]
MKRFFEVLTTPEEWSVVSLLLVGFAGAWTLAVLFGAAFDANFAGKI